RNEGTESMGIEEISAAPPEYQEKAPVEGDVEHQFDSDSEKKGGHTKAAPELQRRLKSRHLQMIAIGERNPSETTYCHVAQLVQVFSSVQDLLLPILARLVR
ncbi:hypothetical protein KEM55_007993, partial [Ascosphaera atra]